MTVRLFNTFDPTPALFRDVAPRLGSRGHEVEVVISRARYRTERDLEAAVDGVPGVRISRVPALGLDPGAGAPQKLGVMATYAAQAFARGILGSGKCVNVFLTQPPFFFWAGAVLEKIRRHPYVCVVMDLQPHLMKVLGYLNAGSAVTNALEAGTRAVLQNASAVVAIGRCMEDRLTRMGVPESQIEVIPNWTDLKRVRPVSHSENALRAEMGWDHRLVIMYAGNIGLPQRFGTLLQVADRIDDNVPVEFVLVGDGAKRQNVEQEIERLGLSKVTRLPFLHEHYPLAEIISAGDVHFVSLTDACTGLAVPSKAYTAFAAGRPVIYEGGSRAEIARLVEEHAIGVAVEEGSADQLEKTILGYLQDEARRTSEGERAREYVKETVSPETMSDRYCELITSVLSDA